MHTSTDFPALVSTDWLAAHLGEPDLRVVDGSWYMPSTGRSAADEYAAGHLPGAVRFDLDAVSDRASPLPHMLPSADEFARRMSALGLSDGDRIVVYDGSGVNLSAPRVWWMFRVFGHPAVAVLDGGLARWRSEGRPLELGVAAPPGGRFTARLDASRVRDLETVRAGLAAGREQLLDARTAGRFAGRDPEPRPGMRAGHLPGSRSLPFTDLVAADGTMLPPDELRRRLEAAGVDLSRPVVTTCGSGVTACALAHGMYLLGKDDVAVYDGSWSEWGGRSDTPVETGSA